MQSILHYHALYSLLFVCLLYLLLPITKAQSNYSHYSLCNETYGNYTQGSLFQSNLNSLLNSLASNTRLNDFYNTTLGSDPNKVHGLIQCRGDISEEDCRTCQNVSAKQIVEICPYYKEAQASYDNCWLKYSGDELFWASDSFYFDQPSEPKSASFLSQERTLMNNLASEAAPNNSKLAMGNSSSLYGLVQCTRNSSEDTCSGCLQKLFNFVSSWPYNGSQYYRALNTICFVRYELYQFFESAATPGSENPSGNGDNDDSRRTIIAIVIPAAGILILTIAVGVFFRRRNNLRRRDGFEEYWMKSTESLIFDLSSLQTATVNYSDSNKLGEGGFGSVYKGILPDGQEIAVKRLSLKSTQGLKELKTEVVLVTKLLHRNLVRLLGFCLEEEEKLLVYEYLSNGSLDTFLFDQGKRLLLDWDKRYRIIVGIARGLLYLHEDSQLRIIHRDLKASNILLDEKMNPKISDFGLARLFAESQAQANTNHIAGTFGYMPPEYIMNGHFSIKSDVFSFGVLVLEIVTGRKNSSFHDENLLSYAWQHWSEGTTLEMVDATLRAQHMANDMLKCIQLGLLCVQEDAIDRPTMSHVLLLLSTNNVTCPVPSRPAYFVKRVRTESDISKESSSVIMSAQSTNTFSLPSANEVNEVTLSDIFPR